MTKAKAPKPKPVAVNVYPTTRQLEVLKAVRELATELGHQPTASDVARRLGITRLGARRQLQALEAKGLLSDVPIQVSSGKWEVTEAGKQWLESLAD